MGRLNGKVAIITGAAMGQGEAEAELFAKEGAKVVTTDIEVTELEKVVQRIIDNGGDAIALQHDVSNEENWKQVIAAAIDKYGKIDILVNNAGIVAFEKVADVKFEDFNRIMSINAAGTYLGMKHVIPEMKKNGGGSIVNISSIAAYVATGGAAYAGSKGAVLSMTKNTALEYAKYKIRVNSVHPGTIITRMVDAAFQDEEYKKKILEGTPLPYLGEPIDVAYGALYLASDESRFITGSELIIDGGKLAQ
ncbi:glucose 1-dehydrogenase [Bacillus sp. B15-48]|uniref:SDR family NAD(P)-dependent oxidoreductase n=1 Tax=Bacillus sp. B15-48 TaxID=1548601 RepID=UPI00193F8B50|nr:glucose 1-dehydrogenase [Bacillus sp. B15-48]MBM4761170.1 glucose 1-dehydrogenase [Bacillus sp. B15-48]